jgi:hypothetical protein
VTAVQRPDQFVDLSALLTGFDRVALLGTGMTGEYIDALDAVLPAGTLDELLAAYARLPPDGDLEVAAASAILGDAKLGPVARNVILMWYCGTWTAMPDAWRAAYGASPLDVNRVG